MSELLEKAKRNIEYAMEAEADSAHPDPARVSLATAQIQVLIVIAEHLGRLNANLETVIYESAIAVTRVP